MPRFLLLGLTLAIASPAAAQTKGGPDPKDVQAVVDKAYDFLKSHKKPDGSFEPSRGGPGTPATATPSSSSASRSTTP